jgi:neuronal cell adhesion protein
VSWNPVSPQSLRGKFEGYKIQTWTDTDGEDDRREILVKHDVTRAVVDQLVPFTKNYLVAMTYNTDYNGPQSRTIEVMTPEGTPGPVEMFEGYALGASALLLVWRKPDQPNGILIGYEIRYHEVDGTKVGPLQERAPINNPEETRAKLASLKPATKYRVHIKARTRAGVGEEYV